VIERIAFFMIKLLADLAGVKTHQDFDMTQSSGDLYSQGIRMMASGFVSPRSDNEAIGVYVIRYQPTIQENKYGRYN